MQQNIFSIILASLIGLFLSAYWMFNELRFISTMSEFDQEINWLLQGTVMTFITLLILTCLLLLMGSVGSFSLQALKKELPWKKLLLSILVFDLLVLILAFINSYFELAGHLATQLIVLVLLVSIYIYSVLKYKINPIFFLVTLCSISSLLLFIVFGVNW